MNKSSHNNPDSPANQQAQKKQRKIIFNSTHFINEIKKRYGEYLFELCLVILGYVLSQSILITAIVLIASIILHLSYLWSKQQEITKYKLYCIFFGFCFSGFLFFSLLYFLTSVFTPEYKRAMTICENPQTLWEHFQCPDSPYYVESHQRYLSYAKLDTVTLDTTRLNSYRYFTHLSMNFEANSCFISFYLPANSNTASICEVIAFRIDTIVTEFQNKHYEAEVNSKNKKKLIFTKQVYIYHETPLFKNEIDNIAEIFLLQKISVNFYDNNSDFSQKSKEIFNHK